MTDLAPTALGVGELRERLDSGRLGAVELTRACLERVRAADGALHAFLRLNPRAEEEAARADARIAAGKAAPLTGIPVAVKDNIGTAGLATTCGSAMLDGFEPPTDATAVRRLRDQGAVVLGKTNMDEFGMGSSTERSAFGPTRNPWDRERVPGGSSGGSAVAVAARMAPAALGSDTGGSVRQPAAFCGVVGVKPTYGRVSRSGLVAFGSSLDQVGPLARSVRDAATLLEAIAGVDEADMTSADSPVDDYAAACGLGVSGLRVGLLERYLGQGVDPQIAAAVRGAAERLEREGARVEALQETGRGERRADRWAVPAYYLLANAEASSNLARYDAVRYGRRSVPADRSADVVEASRSATLGPEVQRRIMLGTFALSAGYHDAFYGKAQQARAALREELLALFRGGIDLLLGPVTPGLPFRIGELLENPLDMYRQDVFTTSASLAGLPALSLPVAASAEGLPVGAQLTAAPFAERTLFRAAATLEPGCSLPPPPDAAGPARAEGAR
jgi:aspartyl-tRNA(Asn)/glutamyl-tRNA(Gln) amidotransferase subunit A